MEFIGTGIVYDKESNTMESLKYFLNSVETLSISVTVS
jgi:hypothetical protein